MDHTKTQASAVRKVYHNPHVQTPHAACHARMLPAGVWHLDTTHWLYTFRTAGAMSFPKNRFESQN